MPIGFPRQILKKYNSTFEARKDGLGDKSLFVDSSNRTYFFEKILSQNVYSNPDFYIKSTAALLTGGKISELTDQSGNNNHAIQPTVIHQPTPITGINFGGQAAKFANPNRLVAPNFFTTAHKQNFTLFSVKKTDTIRSLGVFFSVFGNSAFSGSSLKEIDLRLYCCNYDSIDNIFYENFNGNGGTRVRDLENSGKFNIIGQPGATINMFSYNGTYVTMRSGFITKKQWASGDMNLASVDGGTGKVVIGSREIGGNEIAGYTYHGEINEVFVTLKSANQHENELQKIKELNDNYNYYKLSDLTFLNKKIVFDGNSIGYGYNCPNFRRYSDLVMQMFKSGTFWLTNQPGRSTQDLNTQANTRIDVLNGTSPTVFYEKADILVFDEVINDMKNNQITNATTLYNNVKTYCTNRKNANKDLKIVILTPRSRTDTGGMDQATYESTRASFINLMVAALGGEPWFDALVRLDLDARVDTVNATHYAADQVHPNEIGHRVIAEHLYRALLPFML